MEQAMLYYKLMLFFYRNEGTLLKGKLSKFFGAQDMTVGAPSKNLIQFSIPLLIGNLAQLLYSTVDSIIVGQYVGDGALAAIGLSMPIINLLLVLFMGISVGSSIMVAQYFGAKQKENLSKTVGTTLTLTLFASLFIMIGGVLLSKPMLTLLGTPDDIYDITYSYLFITFIGIIGPAYYNILAGILRGLGDSVSPLIFLSLACGLNVVLDLVFVAVFDWGVAGAAWATLISQAISAAFCIFKLLSMRDTLHVKPKMLVPDKKLTMQLARLGLPSGVTQGIFSAATLVIQNLTNTFGTAFIAVSTVVMRVDSFAMMPNFTFGSAMTTYTGQNIGAGKIKRVEEGTKKGMQIGVCVSIVLVLCLLFFGDYLIRMFTSTDSVINYANKMIRILAVGYVAMAVQQILSGVLRGAGETMVPMWISLVTTIITRVPLAYGLAYFTRSSANPDGAPESIFISLLVSWVLGAVLTVIFYQRGKWKNKAVVGNREPETAETDSVFQGHTGLAVDAAVAESNEELPVAELPAE